MIRFQILKDDLTKEQINAIMEIENDVSLSEWDIYQEEDYVTGEVEGEDETIMMEYLLHEVGIEDERIIEWS